MAEDVTYPYGRSRQRVVLRITPAARDFCAFTLWVFVTFVQFKGDQLILYPLALYFAYAIWRDQLKVVPLLARAWVPLLFAAWCLISPIWAVDPVSSFKNALYLILTLMICFHAASVLSGRQIMYAVVIATSLVGVLSFFAGLTSGDMNRGIFPSKNSMGKSMVMMWTAAVAISLDTGSIKKVRIAALAMAVLAFFLGVISESATAVLLMIGTGGVLFLGAIVLKGGINRPSRLALASGLLAALFLALAILLPTFEANPVDIVLEQFGKDSTLTGRTGLWQHASDQIRESPILGVGTDGFWRYSSSPLVQMIFEEYHKRPGDSFNFHNSYYEITVHYGYVGLLLAVGAIIWAQGIIIRGAFRFATMPYVFFFAQSISVLARTTTESDFLRPFVLFHMLFWIGAFAILKSEMQHKPARRKLQPRIRSPHLSRA